MSYNVHLLRMQQEINDFLFCLRPNQHAERDVFLFLIGINSGLRMSDIVNIEETGHFNIKKSPFCGKKDGENTHTVFREPSESYSGLREKNKSERLFIPQQQRRPFGSQYGLPDFSKGR
ncbi:hypothetical protein SAMN04488114_10671 [Carnobacterium iners]|nr:hypothetical protein SAMN04488114_10671 [Carnobacterium iners]